MMGQIHVVVPESVRTVARQAIPMSAGDRKVANALSKGFASASTLRAMVRHFSTRRNSNDDVYGGQPGFQWLTLMRNSLEVTDRQYRYRANAKPPTGPRRCAFCGAAPRRKLRPGVEIGHVNGHEEDTSPENLIWTCRSCNVRCANTLRKARLGRSTRQYNPKGEGAKSLGQWLTAVMAMKGESSDMSVRDAVAMIRATSQDDRSRYAAEIWARRRKRGTARKSEVPF